MGSLLGLWSRWHIWEWNLLLFKRDNTPGGATLLLVPSCHCPGIAFPVCYPEQWKDQKSCLIVPAAVMSQKSSWLFDPGMPHSPKVYSPQTWSKTEAFHTYRCCHFREFRAAISSFNVIPTPFSVFYSYDPICLTAWGVCLCTHVPKHVGTQRHFLYVTVRVSIMRGMHALAAICLPLPPECCSSAEVFKTF